MTNISGSQGLFASSFSFLAQNEGAPSTSLQISQQQQRNGTTAGDRLSFSHIQKLQSQSSNLRAALKNTNEASTITEVASSGLSSLRSSLTRMKELATLSAADGTSDKQRAFADAEFQSLKADIDNTLLTTTFNGDLLLGGATIDGNATSALDLDFNLSEPADSINLAIDTSGLQDVVAGSASNLATKAGATTALADVNDALDALATLEAHVNTVSDNLGAAGAGISSRIDTVQRAGSEAEEFQQEAALAQLADRVRGLNGAAASTIQEQRVNNLFAHLLDIEQPDIEPRDRKAQDATTESTGSSTPAAPSSGSANSGGASRSSAPSGGE